MRLRLLSRQRWQARASLAAGAVELPRLWAGTRPRAKEINARRLRRAQAGQTSCGDSFAPESGLAGVPPWADAFAHLIPLLALPLCLWRLPFAAGFTMVTGLPPMPLPPMLSVAYVGGISVASEVVALSCLGMVRPWGERVPDAVPVLGGKQIPPYLVIVPATLGGAAVTAVMVGWALATFRIGGFGRDPFDNLGWEVLAVSSSGLLSLCGPMVLALTWDYRRRRKHGS